MPRSTIDRIEAGTTAPRLDTLVHLLAATGLEIAIKNHHGQLLTVDRAGEHTYWRRRKLPQRTGRATDCNDYGRVWDDAT